MNEEKAVVGIHPTQPMKGADFPRQAPDYVPYASDSAHYVFDLLGELQKISDASGLSGLAKDIGDVLSRYKRTE